MALKNTSCIGDSFDDTAVEGRRQSGTVDTKKRTNPSAAWVLYSDMMANRAVCRGHVGRLFLPRDVDVAGCLKSDWRISR